MFSAISSAEIFSVLLYFFQDSLFQISILVPTPIMFISFSSVAYVLKLFGNKNLPCLSISHSTAPDKKNLTKSLAFLFVSGRVFNFSSNTNSYVSSSRKTLFNH